MNTLYFILGVWAGAAAVCILFVRGADQRRDWPHEGATKLEAEA